MKRVEYYHYRSCIVVCFWVRERQTDRDNKWNAMNHGKEIVSQTLVIQATALKEASAIHTEF